MNQGLSHSSIALGISVGVTMGIMPVIGISTMLCFFISWLLHLNHILIQAFNYLVYPLQIILYVPFVYAGSKLFGGQEQSFNLNDFHSLSEGNFFHNVLNMGMMNLNGLLLWVIISIPLTIVIYYLSLNILQKTKLRSLIHSPEK